MSQPKQAARSTKHDQFIQEQLQSILEPGEEVLHTGHVWRGLNIFVILLLTGPLGMLLWRHYYAIATDRRLILIRTKMGIFSMRRVNNGVESIIYHGVRSVKAGKILNHKSLTFTIADGRRDTLRLNSLDKSVTGTSALFRVVRELQENRHMAVEAA